MRYLILLFLCGCGFSTDFEIRTNNRQTNYLTSDETLEFEDSMSVKVFNNKKPVKDALVLVFYEGTQILSARTNKNGLVRFDLPIDIRSKFALVKIIAEGYEATHKKVILSHNYCYDFQLRHEMI